jgi:hypothetical protein
MAFLRLQRTAATNREKVTAGDPLHGNPVLYPHCPCHPVAIRNIVEPGSKCPRKPVILLRLDENLGIGRMDAGETAPLPAQVN